MEENRDLPIDPSSEEGEDLDLVLPSRGLLSFYDRLRERIYRRVAADGKEGGARDKAAEALLLAPDLFMLLIRLSLDREVPKATRAMVGGALAYFILPMDLLPEAMMGAAGFTDDVVMAVMVLATAFQGDLEPYLDRHWSGKKRVREVLGEVFMAAEKILGQSLWARLKKTLAGRGISLEPNTEPTHER